MGRRPRYEDPALQAEARARLNRIKNAREEARIRVGELAHEAGLAESKLIFYETGRALAPDLAALVALEAALRRLLRRRALTACRLVVGLGPGEDTAVAAPTSNVALATEDPEPASIP